jgi:hypothetical protein
MDRIDALRAACEVERADPSDETVINGAPYDPGKALRSSAEMPTIPVDCPEPQIADRNKASQGATD